MESKPISTSAGRTDIIRMTDQEFHTLTSHIKEHYGIDLTKKRILIESRMAQELHRRGFSSFRQYMDVLFQDTTGQESMTLLNKLTTNLSYFMRENEHFQFLSSQVLPYLERTRKDHVLRIWSAGCSSGQEAYNIAMVLDEYFGSRKSQWDTRILATDLSMKVLTKAKQGIYTADEIKDLPAKWKDKYLVPTADGRFKITEKIHQEVIFRPGNLMEPFQYKKPFDLIFCRNVMIYFDAPTKATLVNKFYNWTAPGGYLFIGHSESISTTNAPYTYIQPAIYQRSS